MPPVTKLTAGQLSYKDVATGQQHALVFQFNPEELTRSRSVTITATAANDDTDKTKTMQRGGVGRRFTSQAGRWSMDLTIRLDASIDLQPGQNRSFQQRVQGVQDGIGFLESIVEPGPVDTENDSTYNFEELPPPPNVEFAWGSRTWNCVVTRVSIKELQYTPDLLPTRIEASVSLETIATDQQLDQGKTGGRE